MRLQLLLVLSEMTGFDFRYPVCCYCGLFLPHHHLHLCHVVFGIAASQKCVMCSP